ncbi:MAG TPA: hypothetical protein VFI37_01645 [Gaiellaceae bacterium]|jgi:plasmid stability protein|nr:hypothetical protein [Gaiellaceae bacterium]
MSAIQVKNVPSELHAALRERAAAEQMTVGDYVLLVLRRDLALPSQREWLDGLEDAKPVTDVDAVAALDEARGERDDELAAARRR